MVAQTVGVEEWRPIPGYPDGYEVSNLGRIRSWAKGEPRLMKLLQTDGGYNYVSIWVDSRPRRLLAHRAVLTAFVGPPPKPKHETAHGNGVRSDNRVSNLRWATRVENAADRLGHGNTAFGSKNNKARLTEEQVAEIKDLLKTARYGDKPKIAQKYGVCVSTICRIREGRNWKAVRPKSDLSAFPKESR